MAQYSANLAPDLLAKAVYESPSWGHYELFGIASFFRDRVFPNDTGSKPSSVGAYNDSTVGGGIGGSVRVPTLQKHLDVGLKGLWGDGTGRYGSSTIADLTVRPDGQLALIHNFSALGTLTYHVTPRLDVYANYGGDYVGRRYFLTSPTKSVGYGSYLNVQTGCNTEPVPGTTITGYSPATSGQLHRRHQGRAGVHRRLLVQHLQRTLRASPPGPPICLLPAQHLVRHWHHAQGTDNMFWTSFRYYLP